MAGHGRILLAGLGLFMAWIPVASIRAQPVVEPVSNRTLDIVVDVTEPAEGIAKIEMTVDHVDGSNGMYFAAVGAPEEYALHSASFADASGKAIPFERDRRYWRLAPFSGNTVVARYKAKPGGMGRHGHQGWIGPEWASFDGRVFLMPEGVAQTDAIRVRYEMPAGWVAATPFEVDGDWHQVSRFNRRVDVESLQRSCVGLGPFRETRQELGEMQLRIYTPESFEEAWSDRLHRDTARIGAWFHASVGFDLKAPYSVVWLPRAPDGERVWGGAWANGACYEHDVSETHNWLLLGHRFAHPINEYNPAGLMIGPDRDRWFIEGWAAYVEIVAAEATEVIQPESGFNKLYTSYLKTAFRLEQEVPLSQHHIADPELREFVHYRLAPLTVKLLDDQMRRRTGQGVEAFMAHLYAEHAWKKGAVDLREELATFTGESWDVFWATHVDAVAGIYPSWDGYEDPRIPERLEGKPMAFAGGSPVSASYLHFLSRTGDFASYAEIRDFVVTEGVRRAHLRRQGIRLLPPALHDKAFGLKPPVRYRLAKAERAYPMDAVPRPAARGCGAPALPDLPAAEFVLNTSKHPSAVLFEELLVLERDHEAAMGPLAGRIGIRVGDGETLKGSHLQIGVGPGETLLGTAEWHGVPHEVTWEIVRDGAVEQKAVLTHEPGWKTSWEKLEGERSKGEAILRLRVTADGQRVGERPIWQR